MNVSHRTSSNKKSRDISFMIRHNWQSYANDIFQHITNSQIHNRHQENICIHHMDPIADMEHHIPMVFPCRVHIDSQSICSEIQEVSEIILLFVWMTKSYAWYLFIYHMKFLMNTYNCFVVQLYSKDSKKSKKSLELW